MSNQDLGPIERMEERRFVTNLIKKYWPHLSAFGLTVVMFLMPSVQAYIAANPKTAVGVLLSAVVGAYHLTPPSLKQ